MKRDPYLDALRGFSLAVVVLWHVLATRLTWDVNGPHASSLLAEIPGLWLATWVLQVMPVFFFIGGYLHLASWRPGFVRGRLLGLARPIVPLLAGAVIVGAVLTGMGGFDWAAGTTVFALSPLWFLGVYALLVSLMPVWVWLYRRLGAWALVLLAGIAAVVDAARFGLDVPALGWINLVVVWALAHQAGFHYQTLTRAPRRVGVALIAGGVVGLLGLLRLGYPGSMVGVPGDRWSNVSPPTLAIVVLLVMQLGLLQLLRSVVTRLLDRPAGHRILAVANCYGMPVYLLHMPVFLLGQAVGAPLLGGGLLSILVVKATRRRHMRRGLQRGRATAGLLTGNPGKKSSAPARQPLRALEGNSHAEAA